MVKTELSYNPYLLETEVKFNGQKPRINSPVEKYLEGKLQDWIEKIPQIFHDEMNGYDFELSFSGTKDDYEKVLQSFKIAGVKDTDVEIFFKNELEDAIKKNCRIVEMLQWFENNPNRRFDYSVFKSENRFFLENPYSFIIINGNGIDEIKIADENISIENISDICELDKTDLLNTPIVFYIKVYNPNQLQKDLEKIRYRKDVIDNQVFFLIHPSMNVGQLRRTIYDLGIRNPQIIEDINDELVEDYFKVYPLTDFIKDYLVLVNQVYKNIKSILDDENEKSKIKNSEIHAQIDDLEDDIHRLKLSHERIEQRDNLDRPDEYTLAEEEFFNTINDWRKKKTKTTNIEEAQKMSAEFDGELERAFSTFLEKVKHISSNKRSEIEDLFMKIYASAAVDQKYKPSAAFAYELCEYSIPKLYGDFLEIKTEKYIDAKTDFLDILRGNSDVVKEQVLETTFLYEQWRQKAKEVYAPIMNTIICNRMEALETYYMLLANMYINHIKELIAEKTDEKDKVAAQLSDDERLLQLDNDWLACVCDMITGIERG